MIAAINLVLKKKQKIIAFSHLPTKDRGNKPCNEKNPYFIDLIKITQTSTHLYKCTGQES